MNAPELSTYSFEDRAEMGKLRKLVDHLLRILRIEPGLYYMPMVLGGLSSPVDV
jgi:hypothetical protein